MTAHIYQMQRHFCSVSWGRNPWRPGLSISQYQASGRKQVMMVTCLKILQSAAGLGGLTISPGYSEGQEKPSWGVLKVVEGPHTAGLESDTQAFISVGTGWLGKEGQNLFLLRNSDEELLPWASYSPSSAEVLSLFLTPQSPFLSCKIRSAPWRQAHHYVSRPDR